MMYYLFIDRDKNNLSKPYTYKQLVMLPNINNKKDAIKFAIDSYSHDFSTSDNPIEGGIEDVTLLEVTYGCRLNAAFEVAQYENALCIKHLDAAKSKEERRKLYEELKSEFELEEANHLNWLKKMEDPRYG